MGWIDSFNLAIGVAGLSICIIGLGMALKDVFMEQRTRHFFIVFFSILAVYVVFNLMDQSTFNHIGPYWARFARFALFFESLSSSVLTILLTVFLLYQCGEDWRHSALLRVCAALWTMYAVFLVHTQFSGIFYYIDDNNTYHRGSVYPMLLVPVLLIMVINLWALWRRREKLNRTQYTAFALYCLFPLFFMLMQIFFYGMVLIVLGASIGAMTMFVFIQSDNMKRYIEKEKENSQLLTDIMISQINPHFLYNILGSIEVLCDRDSKTAKLAIHKFSQYLRGNMSSLTKERMIPFESELKHTRLYLELEQIRFEDDLQVDYRIDSYDFFLPPLTLEPIVENAVKHGIRKNTDGRGTVLISTLEYDDRFEVQVIDNGPGFDPQTVTGNHEHIGIRNVRERLRTICGGSLIIASAAEYGTVVTIQLPKKRGRENVDLCYR